MCEENARLLKRRIFQRDGEDGVNKKFKKKEGEKDVESCLLNFRFENDDLVILDMVFVVRCGACRVSR